MIAGVSRIAGLFVKSGKRLVVRTI